MGPMFPLNCPIPILPCSNAYPAFSVYAGRCGTSSADMNPSAIKQLIEEGLPGASAHVQGPDGVHFEARVVAQAFTGKPTLARHRMVYATLGGLMGNEIHALALKTVTPDEAGKD